MPYLADVLGGVDGPEVRQSRAAGEPVPLLQAPTPVPPPPAGVGKANLHSWGDRLGNVVPPNEPITRTAYEVDQHRATLAAAASVACKSLR